MPELSENADSIRIALPTLEAAVWCVPDRPECGQPVHVSCQLQIVGNIGQLPAPVQLRVFLDSLPAAVNPRSRVITLSVDLVTEPIEFEVVAPTPGPLPLVFRIYRDFDDYLLAEITATLPVHVSQPELGTTR